MIALAWREADQVTDTFRHWLDASNAQDVKNVLEKMVVQSYVPQPTDLMKGLICEHDDIRQKCRPGLNAYIIPSKGQVHFCPDGVAKPNAADLQCSDLDGFASAKMRSVASTMLYECTYWTQIGDAALNQYIKDRASGASDCSNLSPSDKPINAQNYAFLRGEAYVKANGCTFSDPSPGTRNVDDDGNDEISVSPTSFTGGWCGMHVTQHQKNELGDSSTSNSPDYILSVCIYDANQVLQNQYPGEDGCGQFIALNGQAQAIDTALPHLMYVTVGAVDSDPLLFTYGDQDWGSNDQAHHPNWGAYDSGKREGDTGFSC